MRMTLHELNDYYERLRQLFRAEELLERLRAAALPGAQKVSGMPHARNTTDRVGNLAAEIADVETTLDGLRAQVRAEEPRIAAFIGRIDDLQLRTIMSLRFLQGMEWADVADAIGGGNTVASVSIRCYRFLSYPENLLNDVERC